MAKLLTAVLSSLVVTLLAAVVPDHATAPRGSTVLGMSRAEVLDACGVPQHAGGGHASTRFEYLDTEGEPIEVIFHDDVAVAVHPLEAAFATPRPVPPAGLYPGQPVADALRHLSPAPAWSVGTLSLELRYDDGEFVTFVNGIVAR